MNIAGIAGVGIIGAILSLVLKQYRPEFALPVSVLTGAFIFLAVLSGISPVVSLIEGIAERFGTELIYLGVLMKALAICYITQIAADSCKDAGEAAIAGKVEIAGKIAILIISVPMFEELIGVVTELIG